MRQMGLKKKTCLQFNLSHQGALSDKESQKIQWKTGHHFRALAAGKLISCGLAAQTAAQNISVPAVHVSCAPNSYKAHRHGYSPCMSTQMS